MRRHGFDSLLVRAERVADHLLDEVGIRDAADLVLLRDTEMPHVHRAHRYQFMGKPDSVYITCRCGKKEAVGIWFTTAMEGWDPDHWRLHGHRKMVDCAKRGEKEIHRRIERENRRFERAREKRTSDREALDQWKRFWTRTF